ncbi:MAG: tetratricopeptide repeat protein, partial [Gemmatimonadales bacterium]
QYDLGLYMAHVRMAEIYESQRKYPQAIKERRRAVNANPDDSTLLMDLGITLGKAGQFAEAEEYLAQARAANPRHAMMPFWLGLAQMQQQEFDRAKESFSIFLEMAPARYEQQLTMARQNLAKIE